MSICKTARTALKLTQPDFGVWLAEQVGGDPFVQSQLSRYENGVNQMNKAQVTACAPIVAQWLAEQTRDMPTDEAANLILEALS